MKRSCEFPISSANSKSGQRTHIQTQHNTRGKIIDKSRGQKKKEYYTKSSSHEYHFTIRSLFINV